MGKREIAWKPRELKIQINPRAMRSRNQDLPVEIAPSRGLRYKKRSLLILSAELPSTRENG